MTQNAIETHTMLRTYGKQLISSRRLTRYVRRLRGDRPAESQEQKHAKRMALVEQIARELVDNLLVLGIDNPVVNELKQRLEVVAGGELFFEYPYMEQDLQVFKNTPDGPVRLNPEETQDLLAHLWEIALDTVDRSLM
ncbi:MAG: DVU0524 family FlgM-associated protein [Desulfovibrio sp.]|uniref:DVU0524 family FlgM-associated protein n=1 Tax=Desulfovibrio sp. 7SRBS1 TaxID=3378064 RepID=UPI003B3D6212